jgi:hypothetical protein
MLPWSVHEQPEVLKQAGQQPESCRNGPDVQYLDHKFPVLPEEAILIQDRTIKSYVVLTGPGRVLKPESTRNLTFALRKVKS